MTLLGKIFTMLIFIMSIGFLFVSVMVFATHKQWKLAAINPRPGEANHDERFGEAGLKFQIEDARSAIEELKIEQQKVIDQLERERAARRMALQQLQAKENTLAAQLDQSQTAYNDKVEENGLLMQQIATKEDRLKALIDEVGDLRTKIRLAQQTRDEQFLKVVQLTDQLHQHQGAVRRIEERRNQLALEVAQRKRVMDAYALTVNTPLDNVMPALDGFITKVSPENKNLVEINLGTDDGLREKHELVVFRNKSYLGRIVIRKVTNNAAVGEVVVDTRRGTIRKGDNVTTRFS